MGAASRVDGLLIRPEGARWICLLAPGAGGGIRRPFFAGLTRELALGGVATYRYELGTTHNAPAEARVRDAVRAAADLEPDLPLLAGGKSFGGRMTSQAQAREPLPGVRGLVFLGFPLHPPGKPGTNRADHLFDVGIPMLFLQGTRDAFARLDLLQPVIDRLGARATLHLVAGADHSFKAPRGDAIPELAQAMVDWGRTHLSPG